MVKCLEAEQVPVAFGYPGAAICPFYDCLADSSVHHVLVRTEQNAAHAASGYAQMCIRDSDHRHADEKHADGGKTAECAADK